MNKIFNGSICGVVIAAIVFSSSFISAPEKAEAQAGAVGAAIASCAGLTGAITSSLSSFFSPGSKAEVPTKPTELTWKEKCGDPIAKAAARMVLQSMTNSIINWINSGFEGDPLFISNPKAFFLDIANEVSGGFIEEVGGSFLCEPFKPQLMISLAQLHTRGSYAQRSQCTALEVIDNFDAFADDFSQGGWAGWVTILEPQNNYYGAAYLTFGEHQRRITEAGDLASKELAWGQGFLSMKQCAQWGEDVTNDEALTGSQRKCLRYEIVTPGKMIVEQANLAASVPVNNLITADEINESIASILDALINQMITQGIRSLSGGGSSSGGSYNYNDYYQALDELGTILTEMNTAYDNAYDFILAREDSIGELQSVSTLTNATIACRRSIDTARGSDGGFTQTDVTNLEDRAEFADNLASIFAQEVTRTDILLSELDALITRAENSRTTISTSQVLGEFGEIIANLPLNTTLASAETSLLTYISQARNAEAELAQCQTQLSQMQQRQSN